MIATGISGQFKSKKCIVRHKAHCFLRKVYNSNFTTGKSCRSYASYYRYYIRPVAMRSELGPDSRSHDAGCVFFSHRKIELYEMGWNLREGLRNCQIAAAPYGGPIGKIFQISDRTQIC